MKTKNHSLEARRRNSYDNLSLVAGGCHPCPCPTTTSAWVVSGSTTTSSGSSPTQTTPSPTQTTPTPPQQPATEGWSLHFELGGLPIPGFNFQFTWGG
jgi:hypothetical protein